MDLALRALHINSRLRKEQCSSRPICKMVIAGGYDSRLSENREYLQELKDLAVALDLKAEVTH